MRAWLCIENICFVETNQEEIQKRCNGGQVKEEMLKTSRWLMDTRTTYFTLYLINDDMILYFYFLILLFKDLNDFESKLVAASI